MRRSGGFAAFASAKHGLRALAQSMARELGPQNIHVAHVVIDAAVDTGIAVTREHSDAAGWDQHRAAGDSVRITKARGAFERGFTPNWSIEIFTVSSVRDDTTPIVYEIKDQAGESVEGTFYESELQRVSLPDTFKRARCL